MAARASVWEKGRERSRELGKAARVAGRSCVITAVSPDTQQLEASMRARKRIGSCREYRDLAAGLSRAARRERSHSGLRMASVTPRSKAAAFPAVTRRNSAQSGRIRARISGRNERDSPSIPQPEILGRNGSYVAFRKLHQRVAAFRRYLKENSSHRDGRAARCKDDGSLAQRRATGAVSHAR